MSAIIEDLGIDRLSVLARLELIEQIWDSLPEQVKPDEVPAWHFPEIAERRAEADANPGIGKPWREALARFGVGEECDRSAKSLTASAVGGLVIFR